MTIETLAREPQFVTVDSLRIRFARQEREAAATFAAAQPVAGEHLRLRADVARAGGQVLACGGRLAGLRPIGRAPGPLQPRALGDFLPRIVEAVGIDSAHAVGPDVGTAALLFTEAVHPGTFASIQVGGGGAAFPLRVTGLLKDFIDAPSLDAFAGADPAEIVSGAVRAIPGYDVPDYVVDDYVASYAGTRFVDSIAYVRRYPQELKELASLLSDIQTPVHFLAAKHDPYLSLEDPRSVAAALPHGRVTELDNSHNAWEESPESYAAAVAAWALGGYSEA